MAVLFSFRETPRFTRRALALLGDDSLAQLQWELIAAPEQGAIIKGSGGIRKMRRQASGRGKRGGARVIYYYANRQEEIFLLDIYAKNDQADLSPAEIKLLRVRVEEWLNDEP